jgi:hypothetical protein
MRTDTEPAVVETALPLEPPIRIDCPLDGHEGEHVLYKREGWRFRHWRLWDKADTDGLIPLLIERLVGWELKHSGEPIVYRPYLDRQQRKLNPAVMDELTPDLAAWLVSTYRTAYRQSALPSPKA